MAQENMIYQELDVKMNYNYLLYKRKLLSLKSKKVQRRPKQLESGTKAKTKKVEDDVVGVD